MCDTGGEMAKEKLVDVLKDKEKYGDFSKKTIKYKPDNITIRPVERIGAIVVESSPITTQYNLKWYPFITSDDSLYVIGKYKTKMKHVLNLTGKKGCQRGISILKEYAKLYSNKSIGSIGVAMTESIFNELPEHLIPDDECWLANESVSLEDECLKYGLKYVSERKIKAKVLYDWSGKSNAGEYIVIPLIKLSTDTRISL